MSERKHERNNVGDMNKGLFCCRRCVSARWVVLCEGYSIVGVCFHNDIRFCVQIKCLVDVVAFLLEILSIEDLFNNQEREYKFLVGWFQEVEVFHFSAFAFFNAFSIVYIRRTTGRISQTLNKPVKCCFVCLEMSFQYSPSVFVNINYWLCSYSYDYFAKSKCDYRCSRIGYLFIIVNILYFVYITFSKRRSVWELWVIKQEHSENIKISSFEGVKIGLWY